MHECLPGWCREQPVPHIQAPSPAGVSFLASCMPCMRTLVGRSTMAAAHHFEGCGQKMSVWFMHAHHGQGCIALPPSTPVCLLPARVRIPTLCALRGSMAGRVCAGPQNVFAVQRRKEGRTVQCCALQHVCPEALIAAAGCVVHRHFTLTSLVVCATYWHALQCLMRRHRAEKLGGTRLEFQTCLLVWCRWLGLLHSCGGPDGAEQALCTLCCQCVSCLLVSFACWLMRRLVKSNNDACECIALFCCP